jgi:hypothetical protein
MALKQLGRDEIPRTRAFRTGFSKKKDLIGMIGKYA